MVTYQANTELAYVEFKEGDMQSPKKLKCFC